MRNFKTRIAGADGSLKVVFDPLRIALFVTTIMTVSRVHQHYPFLARLRPVLLFVVAAAAWAYLNPRSLTRTNVLTLWPMRLIAILGVLACGSAVFGISLGATASFILGSYTKTVIFAFLIAVSIRNVRDLYTFVWAYAISCGILVFFSLFVFGLSQSAGSHVSRLSNLDTYDSNDLGVVLLIGLGLTLLLLGVARGKQRWWLLLNLVGISAAIARSGSRGGFIGLVVMSVAALVLVNSVSPIARASIFAAGALALVLGAPPGYWQQMSTVLQPKQDYNYSSRDGRKELVKRGMWYMSQYPVFGIGINNFPRAECTISPKIEPLVRTGPTRCTAAHNSYVQAGAELGIPGFLVWASLVVGGVVAMLRLRGRLPRLWRRGTDAERFMYGAATFFPLAMIGFGVSSFFVSFAWMDPVYIMAAFISGWYMVVRGQIAHLPGPEAGTLASALGFTPPASGRRMRRSAHRSDVALATPPSE